ncbi:MAG: chloride channel protein [Myxococcales bacterium]|nr:chloride channel protein [Myxococcales bacterium]
MSAEPGGPESIRAPTPAWSARIPVPPRFLRLLRRYLPNEAQHLFALTLLVGLVCGLVAVAFHLGIKAAEHALIDRARLQPHGAWAFWMVVTPTVGGLVAGALLTWLVPGARGSGIPQVKQAYATERGRIRFRDAFGKFCIAILQIGSGASLGREGPTVQICAGAAGMLGRATGLDPKNARRLIPVGVAAGIAAAFNAPIAAVTFTIEEIVGQLDHTVLSGVVVAAALAAVIERSVLGTHPIITVDSYTLEHPSSLVFYALLGVAAAVVSVGFTTSLLRLRAGFRTVQRIPGWAHPAVGGLVTGLVAVFVLRFFHTTGVTGGGYETLGAALAGGLGLRLLLVLGAAKLLATVFSYSSGGAGGIFAPSLFIGAMLGGAVGFLDVAALHHSTRHLGAFALVGMGAVFAGVVRAPITSVLIIFEMTGGYGLVLPLMLANMTAYALARRWQPTSIYDALLEQDGIFLHAPRPASIETTLVGEIAGRADTVRQDATIGDACDEFVDRPAGRLLLIVDGAGSLLGGVELDVLRAARQVDEARPVGELARSVPTISERASILETVRRFEETGARSIAVVRSDDQHELSGIVSVTDLVRGQFRGQPPSRRSHEPTTDPAVHARDVAQPAPWVPAALRFAALREAVEQSVCGAVLLAAPGTSLVVLAEDLDTLPGEPELLSLLVAADVAHAIEMVDPDATLEDVVLALGDAQVIAVGRAGERALGIVRRRDLAAAILDSLGARLAAHRENRATTLRSGRGDRADQ